MILSETIQTHNSCRGRTITSFVSVSSTYTSHIFNNEMKNKTKQNKVKEKQIKAVKRKNEKRNKNYDVGYWNALI